MGDISRHYTHYQTSLPLNVKAKYLCQTRPERIARLGMQAIKILDSTYLVQLFKLILQFSTILSKLITLAAKVWNN